MATLDFWIQLEPQPWDVCPKRPIDRSTAEGTLPVGPLKQMFLRSPVTGATRMAFVNVPMPGGALILRRYTEGWRRPDDRKVNPWDLNEPDPTDAGTMGTIPGPVIECNVGDTIRVHFRNMDLRAKNPPPPWEHPASVERLPVDCRTHSLHPHGVVYAREHDGAYPLTPPDRTQPVDATEAAHWNSVGVQRFKQGDRVPPEATFVYTWEAKWPTTAGVWFYHDHSICHHDSTARGAIGIIVVHNPADKENEVDITSARLPGGSWVGSPLTTQCFRSDLISLLPYALEKLGGVEGAAGHVMNDTIEEAEDRPPMHVFADRRTIREGDVRLELDESYTHIQRICLDTYRAPPDQALFLLLFHELAGAGMCINGRKYLGNAPTLLAGPKTRMRFGVVGMGDAFHTFHIHGHRWAGLGPAGTTRAKIEQSAQVQATTPFEDTRVFGPASSFVLTLEEGAGLMRADPPIGEWHLHCHVGHHMMDGMVGSLLIVNGGEWAQPLPIGRACPPDVPKEVPVPQSPPAYKPKTYDVSVTENVPHFNPGTVSIHVGDTVRWTNNGRERHSVTSDKSSWLFAPLDPGQSHSLTFNYKGDNWYHCDFHDVGEPTFAFGRVWVDPAPGTSAPAPSAPAAAPTTHQVQIGSLGFSPGTITIKAGDAVNWTNIDSSPHTATADDHSWTSPTMPGGKSFSRTFAVGGTVGYHCHIHHEMTATIQVT